MTGPSEEFWGFVSYTMGCMSVMIWLCAQMPQIRKNWRRKSVEGLSLGFLVAWIAGDASNLIGCFLTGQLGVQILLASYYCAVDVILASQYFLYTRDPTYLDGFDPFSPGPLASGDLALNTDDNSNHMRRSSSGSLIKCVCGNLVAVTGLSRLVGKTQAAPIVSHLAPAHFAAVSEASKAGAVAQADWSKDIGYAIAYFSTVMYVMSRVPQILHNFQRKSTTGISMMLFISAFLGNLAYTLSIVLSPQSMGPNADRRAFLLNELSYIIGAAGTMLFDCIIVCQWYWYHRVTAHRRRSTEPLDRISRPYLGESRIPTPLPPTVVFDRWASFSSQSSSATTTKKPSIRKDSRASRASRGSIRFDVTPLLASQQPYYNSSNESAVDEN